MGSTVTVDRANDPVGDAGIQAKPGKRRGLLWRVAVGLAVAIVAVLSLISALPVWLLFVWTATPALIAAGLAALDVGILLAMLRFARGPLPVLGGLAALIGVSVLAVFVSQATATTPPPRQPGGIATLEQVELGGTPQWITVRGSSLDNPVLLFLAGGPGGSELAWTRQHLGGLEDHFIVVNWDQPGTGKSYGAFDISTLTPERYVSDAYELTQMLRERFGQDKIYVLGESWGTILGARLVQRHPELFHAYIASAQMVYTVRDDVMGYEFAIDYAEQDGNTALAADLRRTGPPPYDEFWTYAGYLNVLNHYMYANADGEGGGDNRLFDVLTAPEYGLLDKVTWVLGLEQVFEQVYPLLSEIDFPNTVPALEVPVYFLEGRWDVNAFASLVEEYYAVLEAPHKELIWFENSGHTPLYEEPKRFVDVLVNTVLAQTQPE